VIEGSGTARLAAGSQLDAGASGRPALGISAVRMGVGTTRIAKELGIHHDTVRGVLETERMCPRPSPPGPSILDPYKSFIVDTLAQHPTLRASRIYDVIRTRGYVSFRRRTSSVFSALLTNSLRADSVRSRSAATWPIDNPRCRTIATASALSFSEKLRLFLRMVSTLRIHSPHVSCPRKRGRLRPAS